MVLTLLTSVIGFNMQSYQQLHQHNEGDKQRYGNKNKELWGRNFLRWFHRHPTEPSPADEPGQVAQVAACRLPAAARLGLCAQQRQTHALLEHPAVLT